MSLTDGVDHNPCLIENPVEFGDIQSLIVEAARRSNYDEATAKELFVNNFSAKFDTLNNWDLVSEVEEKALNAWDKNWMFVPLHQNRKDDHYTFQIQEPLSREESIEEFNKYNKGLPLPRQLIVEDNEEIEIDYSLQNYLIELIQRYNIMEVQDENTLNSGNYSRVQGTEEPLYHRKIDIAFVSRKEPCHKVSSLYLNNSWHDKCFKDLIFIFEPWDNIKARYKIQTEEMSKVCDLIMKEIQNNDLNIKHMSTMDIDKLISSIFHDKNLEHGIGNLVHKLIKLLRTHILDEVYPNFRKDFSHKWRRRSFTQTKVLSIERYNKFLNDSGQGRKYLSFPGLKDFLSQCSEQERNELKHDEVDLNRFKSLIYTKWEEGLFREAIHIYKDYRENFHKIIPANIERLLKKRLALKRRYKKDRGNRSYSESEFITRYSEASILFSYDTFEACRAIEELSYSDTKKLVSVMANARGQNLGKYEGNDPLVILVSSSIK